MSASHLHQPANHMQDNKMMANHMQDNKMMANHMQDSKINIMGVDSPIQLSSPGNMNSIGSPLQQGMTSQIEIEYYCDKNSWPGLKNAFFTKRTLFFCKFWLLW